MKFKFTIGKKIGAGFGILVLLTLVIFIFTNITLNKSKQINDAIINLYNPSVDALEDLNVIIVKSKMLITNWVFIQSGNDNENKTQLRKLIKEDFPKAKNTIVELAKNWTEEEQESMNSIFGIIEEDGGLFFLHNEVMEALNSFESYEDPMAMFMVRPMVEGGEIEELTNTIFKDLENIISIHKEHASHVSDQMIMSFDNLKLVVQGSGLFLLIGGILIAWLTVVSIVKPVQQLKRILQSLGKGIFPKEKIKDRTDEIGEMSNALIDLVDGLKRTTDFSKEIGSGNFNSRYDPLSDQDTLGHALQKMNNDLKELTTNLEEKVAERTLELKAKNEQIMDSINYAQRIQGAVIPSIDKIKESFDDSFIIYKPKDVVSGDFPWVYNNGESTYLAAVDCTGHGVPGAFMSLVGNFLLNEIIKNRHAEDPAEILNLLHEVLIETLHNEDNGKSKTKDSMDIALCKVIKSENRIEFAGAFSPMIHMHNGELNTITGDSIFIGDDILKKPVFLQSRSTSRKMIPLLSSPMVLLISLVDQGERSLRPSSLKESLKTIKTLE